MGSPEIAIPPLKALLESGHEVAGVASQPDRPAGRGREVASPAVALVAKEKKLLLFQPARIKTNPDLLKEFKDLSPDVIIVVAYGRILPQELLDLPPRGCINLHFSLLPKYRGAAPVQRALINGETETGVTTFFMTAGIDEGPILLQKKVPIEPEDTTSLLSSRLSIAGAHLLLETLDLLKSERVQSSPQNHRLATFAPLLRKEDGWIDWSRKASAISCQIKGMSPWPGAYTFLKDKLFKIHRVEVIPRKSGAEPGKIIIIGPIGVEVACGQDALLLKEVQIEGKKKMEIGDFIKGHPLAIGQRFGKL